MTHLQLILHLTNTRWHLKFCFAGNVFNAYQFFSVGIFRKSVVPLFCAYFAHRNCIPPARWLFTGFIPACWNPDGFSLPYSSTSPCVAMKMFNLLCPFLPLWQDGSFPLLEVFFLSESHMVSVVEVGFCKEFSHIVQKSGGSEAYGPSLFFWDTFSSAVLWKLSLLTWYHLFPWLSTAVWGEVHLGCTTSVEAFF